MLRSFYFPSHVKKRMILNIVKKIAIGTTARGS